MPEAEKVRSQIKRRVKDNWSYWHPIVFGFVQLSKEEYDNAPPMFIAEFNAALEIKYEIERKAQEEAREEQQ